MSLETGIKTISYFMNPIDLAHQESATLHSLPLQAHIIRKVAWEIITRSEKIIINHDNRSPLKRNPTEGKENTLALLTKKNC